MVARVAQGSWTRLPGGHGAPLAVDSDGNLWAVERRAEGEPIGLSRFDGSTWTRPDSSVTYPTGGIRSIVADPEGGVWVLAQDPEAAASRPALARPEDAGPLRRVLLVADPGARGYW